MGAEIEGVKYGSDGWPFMLNVSSTVMLRNVKNTSASQRQTTVSGYFTSEQSLLFAFVP